MAATLGEPVGATVGYSVRLERQVSPRTRIEVVTEGVLTRRLQGNPELEGISALIFDEFHERHLQGDLGLALSLEVQGLRDDLRLVVMSATLDAPAIARHLDDAPLVVSEGSAYPVHCHHLPRDPKAPLAPAVAAAIRRALAEQPGDVLAFLPGGGEIRQTATLLEGLDTAVLPLYGDLPFAAQQRALESIPGRRRVVLATDIAQTSLTVAGVKAVVDSGLRRTPRFDPASQLTRLITEPIARDAAEQRAGRAGRLGPGICYRLWSEASHARLAPHTAPEILGADLAPLALELAAWGAAADALSWLDPPPPVALARGRALLQELEALDARGRLTANGRALAKWPLHPRLGHALHRGAALGWGPLACDVAALLEERDVLANSGVGVDLEERLAALTRHRSTPSTQGQRGGLARVDRTARLWRRQLREAEAGAWTPGLDFGQAPAHAVGVLVAMAYPDRIAQARRGPLGGYRLANGRGAWLAADDPLAHRLEPWLAVAQLDVSEGDGRIFLAAPLARDDLERHFAAHITTVDTVTWDDGEEAVVARRERRLGALVLDGTPLAQADPGGDWLQDQRGAMAAGIRRLGLRALPWDDTALQWRARVAFLHHTFPDHGWPAVDDETLLADLEGWLGPHLAGITRRSHLGRLDLQGALEALLQGRQNRELEHLAPTHLTVPSGHRRRLHYPPIEPTGPTLAVKLQELFGLEETPRVADGRVAVTLELLSPAGRPIQVTQDLANFWRQTYQEVKRELKGRYPKHPWPDDPKSAIPTAKTKQRSAKGRS